MTLTVNVSLEHHEFSHASKRDSSQQVSRLHDQQAHRVRHFVTMCEKPVQQAIGQQDPLEKINAVHRDLLPCALLQFMFEYVSSDHGVMHELLLELPAGRKGASHVIFFSREAATGETSPWQCGRAGAAGHARMCSGVLHLGTTFAYHD